MAETKTMWSDKFHFKKHRQYINEVRARDLNYTLPTSDNSNNFTTGTVTFDIGATNTILDMKNAFFRVRWLYTRNDGTALAAGDIADRSGIIIENDWFYKCFSQAQLTVNGAEVETSSNPAEINGVLKHLNYTYLSKQVGDNVGWMPDKGNGQAVVFPNVQNAAGADTAALIVYLNTNIVPVVTTMTNTKDINTGFIDRQNKFPVAVLTTATAYEQDFSIFPLFGFFSPNRVWKGLKFGIQLQISGGYQPRILYGTSISTDIAVRIDSIQLVVPTIEVTAPLLKHIDNQLTHDQEIFYLNRRHFMRTINNNQDSFQWQILTSKRRVRYIFVWFKITNRRSKRANGDLYWLQSGAIAEQAATATDNAAAAINEFNVQNIRLQVDDQYYPVKDPLNLNIANNNVNDFIKYYQDYAKNEAYAVPQYTPTEFLNIHPVVVYDLTAQKENVANIGLNYMLEINKTGNQALDAHVLFLEEYMSIAKADGTIVRDAPL